MADGMWNEDPSAAAFALPGDAAIEERAAQSRTEEPAPEDPAPEEPTEAVEAAEAPTEEPQAELIGGKFRSVDDLLSAYQQVEQEKGRLAQEVGDYRQIIEQPQAPQQVNFTQFQRLKEENPALAMQQAVQAGDQSLIMEAAEAWEEVAPGAPALFAQNYTLQQQMLAIQQQMEARTLPLEAERANAELSRAYLDVKQSLPDFDERAVQMQRVAEENPELIAALREGSYAAKVRVLKNLYAGTLLENPPGPVDPDNQEAAKAAARESSKRARQEAQVVSATSSGSEAKSTPAEKLGAQWDELDRPFKNGWLGS